MKSLYRFFGLLCVGLFCTFPASALAAEPNAMEVPYIHRYDQRNDRILEGGIPYAITVKGNRYADEGGMLFARDLSTGRIKTLFQFPQGLIRDYQASPSGGVIAVTTIPPDIRDKLTLRLLTDQGLAFEAIEDVWHYAFSPSGDQLVYVTGLSRGENRERLSTGTWVYDIATKKKAKVFQGGHYVAWAGFDGNAYIYEIHASGSSARDRVWRYDPRKSQLEVTPLKGIYFSPTGAYYYMADIGRGYAKIHATASGKHLGVQGSPVLAHLHPAIIGWLAGDDQLVFTTAHDVETGTPTGLIRSMLYDPRTNSVTDLGPQGVVGSAGDQVILYEPGEPGQEGNFRKTYVRDLLRR